MADNVNTTPSGTTPIATDDVGGIQFQRIKRAAGIDGTAVDFLDVASRSDTFTGAGSGTTFGVTAQGVEKFSLQIKGTGGSPTAWTVNLQVSLDGTNWTTILVHANTSPPADDVRVDGQMISTGSNRYPALYFRSNVSLLTLGPTSNIVVVICGRP